MRTSLLFVPVLAALGCGSATPAGELARLPELDLPNQTKCKISKSQSKPLIVEWPAADRAELESLVASEQLVVVRYSGCEMELRAHSRAPGAYRFASVTPKKDKVVIRDEDELYAAIPVHAASFEAELRKASQLEIDMTLVGRYLADRSEVGRGDLQGRCDDATHFVTGLTVGAFEFVATGSAEVGAGAKVLGAGAGSKSSAQRQLLRTDGEAAACKAAAPGANLPPAGCGALLRLEVLPLSEGSSVAASQPDTSSDSPSARPRAGDAPRTSAPHEPSPRSTSHVGGCSKRDPKVARALDAVRPQIDACFERARVPNGYTSGELILNMAFKPGRDTKIRIMATPVEDNDFMRCAMKAAATARVHEDVGKCTLLVRFDLSR